MRFTRHPKIELFQWTKRKLALANSWPERQARKLARDYPLISDLLQAPQAFDLEKETEHRQDGQLRSYRQMRDFDARVWREARRDYFLACDEQRAAIRAAWLAWRGPTTCLYFRYVVDLHTGVMEARYERSRAEQREHLLQALAERSRQAALPLD